MKPILTPTASEVVRCVRETLETWISPALKDRDELSYVTTASHLLSHVERRLEEEGQALLDEARYLRRLLPEAVAWLESHPGNEALSAEITASLSPSIDPDIYPSLRLMSEDVAALRQHVCDVLVLLHEARAGDVTRAREALHDKLRAYIVWQLEREGEIVEPSYRGRGPRR